MGDQSRGEAMRHGAESNAESPPPVLAVVGARCVISPYTRFRARDVTSIGHDVTIDDYSYFSTSLSVGNAVHIGPGVAFLGGRDSRVTVGDGANVSANVTISGGDVPLDSIKGYSWFDGSLSGSVAAPQVVEIGRFVTIGAGAVITESVSLGEGAFIGAGAVVTRSVPAWEVWAGVPARKIGDRLSHRASILDMWERFETRSGYTSKSA